MSTYDPDTLESTAGQKDELDKWNWGAFLWTWIWAIGHRKWLHGVVGLIVGLIIPIVPNIYFALKGNRLAWETGGYATKADLRSRERTWVKAWFIFAGVILALVIIAVALSG